jgi:hypothetical protein
MWDAILLQNFQEASQSAASPNGPLSTLLKTNRQGIFCISRAAAIRMTAADLGAENFDPQLAAAPNAVLRPPGRRK